MAKKKGLPSRWMSMKGTLKSRWRKYKAHLASLRKGGKKKKKSNPNSNPKTKTITKIKYVTRGRKMAKKGNPGKNNPRPMTFMRNKTIKGFVYSGTAIGTALLSAGITEKIPFTAKWEPWQKATLQWAAGATLMWFPKDLIWKMIGGGLTGGGFISMLLPLMKEQGFTLPGFSGRGDDITAAEIAELKLNHHNSMYGNNNNNNNNRVYGNNSYNNNNNSYGNDTYSRGSRGYHLKVNGPLDTISGPINQMRGPIPVGEMGGRFRSQNDW